MADSLGEVLLGIKVDWAGAQQALKSFASQAQRAGNQAADAFSALDQRLGVTTTLVSGLAGAFGTLALGEFLRQSVQAAVELETITRKLSNSLGPQGAAGALNFTRGLADQLGLSFKTLSSTFASFTAAATAAGVPIEQQKALFAAVSKAAQSLGLSNDELSGSLLALQQVASKGTVQMEELRGQLGERLPIAFAAAAKGLGLTQQQLIKLVETGKLTSAEFFPALTKGLNELTASAGGAPTAAQNFQQFANALDELKTSVGEELLPTVVEATKVLTGFVKGVGIALAASKVGINNGTGIFAGFTQALGFIPDQAADAVVAIRNVQQQFDLTDKQARALFTDAAKNAGGTVNAFGQLQLSAEQFSKVLEQLPQLAQQFRDKYPDTTADLQAQNAAADKLNKAQKASINSIDNLNAKLKAQRAELNGVEVGSFRFQELTGQIRTTEEALQAATDAAKGTSAAVAEIRPDTFNVDTQSAALKLNQARLDLAGQIAQAETDLANAKLRTEEALLNAQEKRALQGVTNDRTRAAIQEQFQLKRDELERRSFELKARALAAENAAQVKALELESKLTELAARRGVIAAQAQLSQAQAKGSQGEVQAAQQALSLAQQEYAIAREISAEKIAGTKQLFELRRQQLEQERRAAAADDLPLPQVQQQPGFRAFLDSIQIDPAPIQENSKASLTAAENISNSNTALVDRIGNLEQSIGGLVEKDWTVQVNVTNEAGGAATVNTVNSLQ
jgi:tape measure domain-containing protein